jgi:chemotaxis protein CheX
MTKPKKSTARKNQQAPSMNDGEHMDILMINALLNSLFTIFETMVRQEIQAGIPVLKENNIAKGAASGLIGMKTEGASGSVALSLTLPAIRKISLGMLGEEFTSIDKEAADLVGELTNMLVGGAKRIMSEKGHEFDMHTPQLLVGDGHEIVHHYAGQTVLLPILMNQDEFYIELNFV